MRVLLSVVGLLVVLYVVLQLGKSQLGALSSLPSTQRSGAASSAAPGAPAIVPPAQVSRDIAGQISGAMQSGAAARASEPQ